MTTLYGPQRERVLSRLTDAAEREEKILLGRISSCGAYRPKRSQAQAAARLVEKGEIELTSTGEYQLTSLGNKRLRRVFRP